MKKLVIITFILITGSASIKSQNPIFTADSIRIKYNIPEIGYAVVSSNSILEMKTLGFKQAGTTIKAEPNDRFHLGSNTKAITGFIAALLVKQNKIDWNTKFFDLYPELKSGSNVAFYNITLVDLFEHRARILPFTDGKDFPNPLGPRFIGSASDQRKQFVEWVLTQDTVKTEEKISYSNAGYSIAATMLEKASGKTWEELVLDLGKKMGVDFGFSWPNTCDSSQPWGHWYENNRLIPTPPHDSYILCWVEPAGDINMSISDYAKFIQYQLLGLNGRSLFLSKEEFEFIHYGVPESDHYSIGWTWAINKAGHRISAHNGSAGTFYCFAYIVKDIDRAYIVFANCGSDQADEGVRKLLSFLIKQFGS